MDRGSEDPSQRRDPILPRPRSPVYLLPIAKAGLDTQAKRLHVAAFESDIRFHASRALRSQVDVGKHDGISDLNGAPSWPPRVSPDLRYQLVLSRQGLGKGILDLVDLTASILGEPTPGCGVDRDPAALHLNDKEAQLGVSHEEVDFTIRFPSSAVPGHRMKHEVGVAQSRVQPLEHRSFGVRHGRTRSLGIHLGHCRPTP